MRNHACVRFSHDFAISHYNGVIISAMASQITSLTIVYSVVYEGADQRKYQSSASLAFVRGIHRWLVNSLLKMSVTRKMFPCDDVIIENYDCIAPDDCMFKIMLTWCSFEDCSSKHTTFIPLRFLELLTDLFTTHLGGLCKKKPGKITRGQHDGSEYFLVFVCPFGMILSLMSMPCLIWINRIHVNASAHISYLDSGCLGRLTCAKKFAFR